MRKIIVSEFYSLDGLMSDPKDEMDWVTSNFDAEMGNYEDDLYDNADTLLLGRVTYQIFESYWPTAANNPEIPEGEAEMARKINNITKVVFSRTLERVEWRNSILAREIASEEIRRMKQEPGKNMLIIGSASIAQQFMNLDLVDEVHLLVLPVVLGHGKPLFMDIEDRHPLQLFETRSFKNGVVGLFYRTGDILA